MNTRVKLEKQRTHINQIMTKHIILMAFDDPTEKLKSQYWIFTQEIQIPDLIVHSLTIG